MNVEHTINLDWGLWLPSSTPNH